MNILVTGANGQLGLCLRDIIDAKGNGQPHHGVLDKNYWIFAGHNDLDISNENAVNEYLHKNAINVVVNCAAYTNVDKAETDEENAFKINAEGPKFLAEACKKVGAIMIHISTDYVFDGAKNTPYYPEDKCNPIGVYGRSKFLGEENIIKSGCKYLIFRTSWLYSHHGNNFVKKIFGKIINGERLSIVYDQIGSPTSAIDLANIIYKIITENDADNRYLFKNGIYHVSNKGVASWYDLAIGSIASINNAIKYIKPCLSGEFKSVVKRPNYSVLDCRKTEEAFNVEINYWQTALSVVVHKLKEQEKEARKVLDIENTEFDYGHNINNQVSTD